MGDFLFYERSLSLSVPWLYKRFKSLIASRDYTHPIWENLRIAHDNYNRIIHFYFLDYSLYSIITL